MFLFALFVVAAIMIIDKFTDQDHEIEQLKTEVAQLTMLHELEVDESAEEL